MSTDTPADDASPEHKPGSIAWLRAKAEEARQQEQSYSALANAHGGAAQAYEEILAIASEEHRMSDLMAVRETALAQGRQMAQDEAEKAVVALTTIRDVRKRHAPAVRKR